MPIVKVFFWGMIVSFLGSLPLGTLNVAAMQISVQESVQNAILFALGSLSVEMIYVRVSLVGINWVRKQKKLFRYMEWITVAIVLALAIGSFAAAMKPHPAKNVILNNQINRYLLGVMLSAINPVQIPFWFGWSTVLFTKNILQPKNSFYNFYIVGIGLGTLMGNCVFIFGGKWIVGKLNGNQSLLNWIIGGIFAVTAIIFLIKILLHKDGMKKLEHTAPVSQTGNEK
jgi:threonine/homoserine/homoserine lactone efflux protein